MTGSITFDRGADSRKPCTYCGTRPVPEYGHKLKHIGHYPNGEPIRRPCCSQCEPLVEARAATPAPPPKLPQNTCADCRLPRVPEGEPWDEGTHCPRSLRFALTSGGYTDMTLCERDCLRIGLDKAHANEERMRGLLRTVGEALDAAIAAQVHHG